MTAQIKIQIRTVEFRCEPWVMRNALEIQPIAGTWTLAPMDLRQSRGVKGILACPQCGQAALIHKDMGEKADDLKDLILDEWRCYGCDYHCKAHILDWDKRKLYCAAFETAPDGPSGSIVAHKEYLHAESTEDATVQFWAGHPVTDGITNLVGVALVIGFFVVDDQGRKLTV